MQDLPPAPDLLDAVADLLESRVMSRIDDAALAHEVRVAASLCRIVAREVRAEPEVDAGQWAALAAAVDGDGPTADLEAELATQLLDGRPVDLEVIEALRRLVRGKLSIARPGYAE